MGVGLLWRPIFLPGMGYHQIISQYLLKRSCKLWQNIFAESIEPGVLHIFKSGDRGGILWRLHSISLNANKATLLVWDGSLSITNTLFPSILGPAFPKHKLKCSFRKFVKKAPLILSYGSLKMTPTPNPIANIKWRRLPPASSLLPFAVIFKPSPLLRHTRVFGCIATFKGLCLCTKDTPSK